MAETPQHTYQLLTKRPRRLARMADSLPWPKNVWVGVSVENQEQAWRVSELRKVPAAVRFVSAEPLLGPLSLDLSDIEWVIVGGESGPNHHWETSVPDAAGIFNARLSGYSDGIPMTYVSMTDDVPVPPQLAQQMIANLGADVEHRVLTAGHTVMVSKPKELAAIINDVAARC